MAAAQAVENHGVEWGLAWCFQWGIYTDSNLNPHSKFLCRSRSTKFKDIIPLNISQMMTIADHFSQHDAGTTI